MVLHPDFNLENTVMNFEQENNTLLVVRNEVVPTPTNDIAATHTLPHPTLSTTVRCHLKPAYLGTTLNRDKKYALCLD